MLGWHPTPRVAFFMVTRETVVGIYKVGCLKIGSYSSADIVLLRKGIIFFAIVFLRLY
jgi:hypothetical protein